MGTPWALLGIPWGSLGDSWGLLGIPRGPLGDHLDTYGDVLGSLGTPWRSLGDHLPLLLDALGASWGFFGGNLDLQGALMGSQRGSRRPVGGLVLAFWKLRKCLRSNWLQYGKTMKFTVRYCKNRGLGRLKPLKISLNFHNTREKKHKKHELNNIVSKIDTRVAKMAPRSSKMSPGA